MVFQSMVFERYLLTYFEYLGLFEAKICPPAFHMKKRNNSNCKAEPEPK